jgi:Zn finger protein HypA/HybF involved in hydrogenase expression
VITLGRRLEVLERSVGGACQKCAGIMMTIVNGEVRAISRHGQPLRVEERSEFEATRPRCPECGAGFLEVRVPNSAGS